MQNYHFFAIFANQESKKNHYEEIHYSYDCCACCGGAEHAVEVVETAVEAVVEAFLKGFVFDSGIGCHAHECGEHNH